MPATPPNSARPAPARRPSLLRRFARDTEGYVTLEVVIMLPVLLALFAAAWIYFDIFRQQAIGQKANFAIGDMISRETEGLDDDYIDAAFQLLALLTKTETDGNPDTGIQDISMRITVVEYVSTGTDTGYNTVKWSRARGDMTAMSESELNDRYLNNIPLLQDADEVILVETREHWYPALRITGVRDSVPGLGETDLYTYSFTSPRYTSQVVWDGADLVTTVASDTNCSTCTNADGTSNNEGSSSYPDRDWRYN